MKITKRQLRRIIREEKRKLVEAWNEPDASGQRPHDAEVSKQMARLDSALEILFELMEPEELAQILYTKADEMTAMYG